MENNPLTEKIGPLPGYVWVIIVGGIAWLFYMRTKAASAAATAAPVDSTFPVVYGDAPGTGEFNGLQPSGPTGTQTQNNASWAKMVTDALITAGGDPLNITNAISNWLNGGSLSPDQQSIVNTVLRQYGSPPNGIMPGQQKEASAYVGTYTVQQGDTLSKIMERFYGAKPMTPQYIAALARISAANNLQWNAVSGTYDIKAGQQLKLYQDSGVGIGNSTWKGMGA